MHLARYDVSMGKYTKSSEEKWCELLEISHNGSYGMSLTKGLNEETHTIGSEHPEFDDWISMIIEGSARFSGIEF